MNSHNKRIFATLFFALFTAVTGVGIVVPLLPVYAHELGAGGFAIGLIFGIFSLSRSICMPYFGRRSDQQGRKPFIVIGLSGYMLVSVAFIWADTVLLLVAVRFLQGILSAMIMPVVQAYVGDITPSGKEGATMGIFNMSLFLGLSLGPVLGGVIKDYFSLKGAFLSMGLLSLIACLLCISLLPARKAEGIVRHKATPLPWKRLLADRQISGLFLFRMAYTACIGIIWGFLPVMADADLGLSSSLIGVLVMLGVLIAGILQTPMGYLADRLPKQAMMVSGGILVALSLFIFSQAQGIPGIVLANTAFGLGGSIAMPPLMAIAVVKGQKTHSMGAVMALLTVGHSLGMMAGSLFAGVVMDGFGLRIAFFSGTLIMLSGIVVLLASNRQRLAH
ncbi:MAG: MFS transporter [Desulfobacterales bacterium]